MISGTVNWTLKLFLKYAGEVTQSTLKNFTSRANSSGTCIANFLFLLMFCRKAVSEYMKYIIKLKTILSALLSEALGLSSDYLASMESMETESLVCQFYPPCPEPELTFGASKHSDPSFLTVLLQDHIGGLQVLHRNYWADVPFVQGALVINIGDFIQASYLIWKIHSVGYIY